MLLFFKVIFFSFFLLLFSSLYSQSEFPKYEEVLTYLDKKIITSSKVGYFNLSKRPEGYFLEIKDYTTNKSVVETLVWEFKSKDYKDLNLNEYLYSLEDIFKDFTELEMKYYLKENSVNGLDKIRGKEFTYDFYPFYGYPNWSTDIIELYRTNSEKSLKDLECLARAYDHKACNYIHPGQYDFPPIFAQGFEKSNYQNIDKFRVSNFIKYADSSLYCYDEIIKIDSNYNTYLIGNVELKRSNNCMNYYLYLNSVKEATLANDYLLKVNYPLPFIKMAKDYLKYCDEKSILITDGDSDTYPLWYVQNALNYKKDILVLNFNLLNLPWYSTMVKEKNSLQADLNINNVFKNEISYYLADFDSVQNKNSISNFIDVLNKFGIKKHVGFDDKIKMGGSYSLKYLKKSLPLTLSNEVLYLNEAVLLDIINNNDLKLYFASKFKLNNYDLISYLGNRFLIFELFNFSVKELYSEEGKSILNKEIDLFNPDIIEYSGNLSDSYLFRFYHYLSFLESKGENESKKELSNLLNGKLSNLKLMDVDLESIELVGLILNRIDSTNSFKEKFYIFLEEELGALEITRVNFQSSLKKLKIFFHILRNIRDASNPELVDEHLILLKNKILSLRGKEFPKSFKWTKEGFVELKESIEELIKI